MKKMIYLGCYKSLLPWYGAECWFFDAGNDGLSHVIFADTDALVGTDDLLDADLVYGVIGEALERFDFQPDTELVPGPPLFLDGQQYAGLDTVRIGASFIEACKRIGA